jgi:hypothetical protein
MMETKQILGIVAGIISFIAYIIYVRSIVRGESKPNRTTWWIWTFMGLVLLISYYFSGARNTIWAPLVEFIGPLIIAILSIKYGEGGVKDRTDVWCFCGALFSIVLWIIFDSPVIALVTNLAIDAFALVPTIKKSWNRPQGENFWAWFGTGVGDTMNIFAIERMSFGIVVYPVWMLLQDLVIIVILFKGKIKKFGRISTHIN